MENGGDSDNNDSWETKFRRSIHQGVTATNAFLAKLQSQSAQIRQPIAQSLQKVEETSTSLASQALLLYERRHEYGPHIVVGSALLAGGIMNLRRGRLVGIFSGTVVGGLSYLVVYEPQWDDIVLPRKK